MNSGAICCLPNKRDLRFTADRRLNLLQCLPPACKCSKFGRPPLALECPLVPKLGGKAQVRPLEADWGRLALQYPLGDWQGLAGIGTGVLPGA